MGEEIHGWSVLCERDHFRGLCTRTVEHAHKPLDSPILSLPEVLFNMGPAYMFSRGVETLRIDGYLALVLLTHGELVSFHRLMKYGEPLSMGRTHLIIDTYSYKCAAGVKTILVEYLLMQNRHLSGEEKNRRRERNGGRRMVVSLY